MGGSSEDGEVSRAEDDRRTAAVAAADEGRDESEDSSSEDSGYYDLQNNYIRGVFEDTAVPAQQIAQHHESGCDPFALLNEPINSRLDEVLRADRNQDDAAPPDAGGAEDQLAAEDNEQLLQANNASLSVQRGPDQQHPVAEAQYHLNVALGGPVQAKPPPWFQKFAQGFIQLQFQSLITQLPRDYIPADGGTVSPPAAPPHINNVNEEIKKAVELFKTAVLGFYEQHRHDAKNSEVVAQHSSPAETLVPLLPSPTRDGWHALHMTREQKPRKIVRKYKTTNKKGKSSGKTKTHRTQRPRKKQKTAGGVGPSSAKKDSTKTSNDAEATTTTRSNNDYDINETITTTVGDDQHHQDEGKNITAARLRQHPEGP